MKFIFALTICLPFSGAFAASHGCNVLLPESQWEYGYQDTASQLELYSQQLAGFFADLETSYGKSPTRDRSLDQMFIRGNLLKSQLSVLTDAYFSSKLDEALLSPFSSEVSELVYDLEALRNSYLIELN